MKLTAVIDCRDVSRLGLTIDQLCHDTDWHIPQTLAFAARASGAEALLVPSASRWGENLIVFPDLRRAGSSFEIIRFAEPRLYREQREGKG